MTGEVCVKHLGLSVFSKEIGSWKCKGHVASPRHVQCVMAQVPLTRRVPNPAGAVWFVEICTLATPVPGNGGRMVLVGSPFGWPRTPSPLHMCLPSPNLCKSHHRGLGGQTP